VGHIYEQLHHVDVGCIDNASEILTASILKAMQSDYPVTPCDAFSACPRSMGTAQPRDKH